MYIFNDPVEETTILIENARLALPSLFTKKPQATFLFPKDCDRNDHVPGQIREFLEGRRLFLPSKCYPIQDGDEKQYDGFSGNYFLRASAKDTEHIMLYPSYESRARIEKKEDNVFYAGCYVNAFIRLRVCFVNGNRFLSKKITALYFKEDGERLKSTLRKVS